MIERVRQLAHGARRLAQEVRAAPPTDWDPIIGGLAVLLGGRLVRRYVEWHFAGLAGVAADSIRRDRQPSPVPAPGPVSGPPAAARCPDCAGEVTGWAHACCPTGPSRAAAEDRCPDCDVAPGARHEPGCDVARCAATGRQRLSCDIDHDHGNDIWSGEWPYSAEAADGDV